MASYNKEVTTYDDGAGDTRAHVDTRSPEQIAVEEGRAFCANIGPITPTGAGDYFAYIENLAGSGRNMHVYRAVARVAAADVLTFDWSTESDNSAAGATADTPSALNSQGLAASSLVLVETDPDLGLTEANVVGELRIAAANTDYEKLWPEHVVLTPGNALRVAAATGTTAVNIDIYFYFE